MLKRERTSNVVADGEDEGLIEFERNTECDGMILIKMVQMRKNIIIMKNHIMLHLLVGIQPKNYIMSQCSQLRIFIITSPIVDS